MCSGIQNVLFWSFGVFSFLFSIGVFLHTANPIVFMDLVHWFICVTMAYISTPATIWLLSWILFGRFLVGMISSHEDVPAICAASCKLVILTSHDTASGKIFEQFENADGLVKLLNAISQQLKRFCGKKRIEHMANLLPMSRVLVMLVGTHEGADHRMSAREVACAILKEYRDVPSANSEVVAQVLCNAVCTVELLVVHCGKLTFSADTNTYTGAPSDEDIAELRILLDGLFNDAVFSAS
eukprot:gene37564-49164_t